MGHKGCLLPSGLFLHYPELSRDSSGGSTKWTYKTRKGLEHIYGAKFFQGLVQSVARCIIAENMLKIGRRYQTLLTIHDAVYILVPEGKQQEASDFVLSVMRKPPKWMADIPLNAEVHFGKTLADC